MQTEKVCKSCGISKAIEHFAKNGKCGRHPRCKLCRAQIERERRNDTVREQERNRYHANKEARAASVKKYYEANRAAILARNAALYESKADSIKQATKEYRQSNRDKVRAWNGSRRALLRNACPPWADKKAIAAVYKMALDLENQTGVPHHVDHIIPLAGRDVCGLHVAENLQAIPARDNLTKGIKFVKIDN